MTIEQNNEGFRRPLRLWPGVVLVAVQWLLRFGIPLVAPDGQLFGFETQLVSIFAGPAGLLAIAVWWLFFSRARWFERVGAIVAMVAAVVVTRPLMHQSIENGFQGMMFALYAVPATLSLGLACGVELYGLAAFATVFILGVLWVVESLEPERRKTFDLKVTDSDPSSLRSQIEAILRRHKVTYELRSTGPKELTYETELPLEARTDRISNSILQLKPGSEMEVNWEEKKKK